MCSMHVRIYRLCRGIAIENLVVIVKTQEQPFRHCENRPVFGSKLATCSKGFRVWAPPPRSHVYAPVGRDLHIITHTRTVSMIHAYKHICIHACLHKYIHAHLHTYIHACSMHNCVYTYIHTYIRTYIHTYIHTSIIHTYIHTYIHT